MSFLKSLDHYFFVCSTSPLSFTEFDTAVFTQSCEQTGKQTAIIRCLCADSELSTGVLNVKVTGKNMSAEIVNRAGFAHHQC